MPAEPPSAVTTACPDCGEDTLHAVLKGKTSSGGGAFTLDATVQCTECQRVHHALIKEAAPADVAVVVSHGNTSRRTRLSLPGDSEVSLGEAFIIDGVNCRLTGIEAKDMRWVDDASLGDVKTLWVMEFEELPIGFAINMGHKTIAKSLPAKPTDEFTVGQEHLFGRLRITVHAIKTKERLLKRGTAEAQDIVRIFGKPTPLGGAKPRPDKKAREQLRFKEERDEARAHERERGSSGGGWR